MTKPAAPQKFGSRDSWLKLAEAGLKQAMPTSKRKGVPGKCSLPADFIHNPGQRLLEQYTQAAMLNPWLAAGIGGPMSLAQLQQPALALTYPSTSKASAAESVKSILVARNNASFPLMEHSLNKVSSGVD